MGTGLHDPPMPKHWLPRNLRVHAGRHTQIGQTSVNTQPPIYFQKELLLPAVAPSITEGKGWFCWDVRLPSVQPSALSLSARSSSRTLGTCG